MRCDCIIIPRINTKEQSGAAWQVSLYHMHCTSDRPLQHTLASAVDSGASQHVGYHCGAATSVSQSYRRRGAFSHARRWLHCSRRLRWASHAHAHAHAHAGHYRSCSCMLCALSRLFSLRDQAAHVQLTAPGLGRCGFVSSTCSLETPNVSSNSASTLASSSS